MDRGGGIQGARGNARTAPRREMGGAGEAIIFWLFVVGIAAVPFWFGSNRPQAWYANGLFFGLLVVAYELRLILLGRHHPVALGRIWPAALGVAAVFVWGLIQCATWVPQGWDHPVWQITANTLGQPVAGMITVNRTSTLIALFRLLTSASVFWLALQLSRGPRRGTQLLTAVAIIGIAYAIYGLMEFFLFPNMTLWFPKLFYRESLTSTFINRNSCAAYIGTTCVACMGLVLGYYRRAMENAGVTTAHRVGALIQVTAGRGGWLLIGLCILLAALMLTGSRGGISASLAGLLVLLGLVMTQGKKSGRAEIGIIVMLMVLVVAAVVLYGQLFFLRMDDLDGGSGGGRLATYSATWHLIMDSPWRGTGYGTFADIFPMYRNSTIGIGLQWDKAHDTYLELFQGLGVPMGIVFIAAVASLVLQCVRGTATRKRNAMIPAVAVSASAVLGLHALVDFSLQIQAITLTWLTLLGAGVAQSWSSQFETSD